MTTIRITLTGDDFKALVSGRPVIFKQQNIVRSEQIHMEPTNDDNVAIILEDMGWPDMAAIIEEVWKGDAPERKP